MQNPSAGGVGATGGAGDICGAGNTGVLGTTVG